MPMQIPEHSVIGKEFKGIIDHLKGTPRLVSPVRSVLRIGADDLGYLLLRHRPYVV
jgi:hypothetical protein